MPICEHIAEIIRQEVKRELYLFGHVVPSTVEGLRNEVREDIIHHEMYGFTRENRRAVPQNKKKVSP